MPWHLCPTLGTLLRAPKGVQTHSPSPHGWTGGAPTMLEGCPGLSRQWGQRPWDVGLRG